MITIVHDDIGPFSNVREGYTDSYVCGLLKPHFPVPSTDVYSAEDYFAAYYALELCKEFFREGYTMTLTTLWHDEKQDITLHDEYDTCNWRDAYRLGYCEPHYPVPAICVRCFFHDGYIVATRYNGSVGYYGNPGYAVTYTWYEDHQ